MEKKKIIFRADGNRQIGWGHVYRLLALAEELRHEFECIFVIDAPDPFILSEIIRICSGHIILNKHRNEHRPDEIKPGDEMAFDMTEVLNGGEIVVVDGYLFGSAYQHAIKNAGCYLICIDDLVSGEYHADVIINPSLGISRDQYLVNSSTKVCLGLDYIILRPAFFDIPLSWPVKKVRQVYITFGGSDVYQYSLKCLEICLEMQAIETFFLVFSETFSEEVKSKLANLKEAYPAKIRLLKNIGAEEIVEVLRKCTHAIVSSSTVCLEVISQQVKPLIGHYARNQLNLYNGLINESLAVGLGDLRSGLDIEIMQSYLEAENSIQCLFSNAKLLEIFKV